MKPPTRGLCAPSQQLRHRHAGGVSGRSSHGRTRVSRRLSFVLRHDPGSVGISLDEKGWVDIGVLLEALAADGLVLTRRELDGLVAADDKQRFGLDEGGTRIRANQGHSVAVDLGLAVAVPPPTLYHGTVAAALESIAVRGLLRGQRHHVHLSPDTASARRVGARRGSPVALTVDAAAMSEAGIPFFRSANGVWLTAHVPARYLALDGAPLAGGTGDRTTRR